MRVLPAALAAHLASGVTTLCTCWRLTRRDGTVLGFTDHDRDLTFDGTVFEAASGFTATAARETADAAVDNLEVEGALDSAHLSAADLAAGLYDDARIEIWRVNWQSVAERVRLRVGSLGEISHSGRGFRAEVRGLTHYLQQERGRLYQYACDADLGDARCTVALSDPRWQGTGNVLSVPIPYRLIVGGLSGFASGWFTRGLLTWTSGPANGRSLGLRLHEGDTLDLWEEPLPPVATGWTFRITAGCDKSFATCRTRFGNSLNYRGFPHMPGNDFVTRYPSAGDGTHDGQSQFR